MSGIGRLDGKTAILTGAAGGIGLKTAEIFAAEGAKLLLVDRDQDMLTAAVTQVRAAVQGAEVEFSLGDVSKEGDANIAAERALAAFGGIDILVNNAAIRDVSSVLESQQSNWERLMSVNLLGAVNFYKATAAALRKSGNASVVNVASIGAVCGRRDWGIYDATKAALLALTRTLACEEAAYGVRVNAVCAAGTVTPFTVGRVKSSGRAAVDLSNETRSDNLLGRWAQPTEMAYPILWLASGEASFMTGATLMVDAGRSIK